MAKERIGIMGGTFNPIHQGHLTMALAAKEKARLDEVLVIPSGHPPHKAHIAPAEDRWRMVCAACAQESALTPCRVELDRPGVIYTVDTLSILREKYPKAEWFYIIGADTLMELRNWHRFQEVLGMCTFLVCPRATKATPLALTEERHWLEALGGRFIMLDIPPVEVSSTDIRQALEQDMPTSLLPVTVREYCGVMGLYGMAPRVPQARGWMDRLFAALTAKRFAHTLTVAYTARGLALAHHLDVAKAEAAGLLHDCAKCLPLKEQQHLAREHRLTADEGLMESGALLHAVVGAYLAQAAYGVTDAEILEAIRCHTTGKPEMSRLDMAVYLADAIEPTREAYPMLNQVRLMAQLSLERAMTASLEGTAGHVQKSGRTLHPATLETLNWLRTLKEANAPSTGKASKGE